MTHFCQINEISKSRALLQVLLPLFSSKKLSIYYYLSPQFDGMSLKYSRTQIVSQLYMHKQQGTLRMIQINDFFRLQKKSSKNFILIHFKLVFMDSSSISSFFQHKDSWKHLKHIILQNIRVVSTFFDIFLECVKCQNKKIYIFKSGKPFTLKLIMSRKSDHLNRKSIQF